MAASVHCRPPQPFLVSALRKPDAPSGFLHHDPEGSLAARAATFKSAYRHELIVNGKTAQEIGVTIPSEVLRRADRLIE